MKKIKFKKINIKKIKLNKANKIILGIILILLLVTFSSTLGRFIYKELRNSYFNTKNFYFESDKLKETQARYEITNYNGVDTYSTTINMNSIKNNKVKSDNDIAYDLRFTCSSNANCSISKESGTIYATSNNDSFTITMTPNTNLKDNDSIYMTVYAKSSSPYVKEISASFVLKVGKSGLSYEISDNTNDIYMELKITNTLDYYNVLESFGTHNVGDKIDMITYLGLSDANKSKCASAIVSLDFDPNLLRLDMTNTSYLNNISSGVEAIGGYNYLNKFSFKIDAISSVIIKFYKIDTTNNYTYNGIGNSIVKVTFS